MTEAPQTGQPATPPRPDAALELLRVLPELAVTLYRSAPHAGGDRGLAAAPLTYRQMDVVLHLRARGRQTMGELAAGLGVSKASATEMIERLVEKGLVRRATSPGDRRVVAVELSGSARRRVDRSIAQWRTHATAALARFPDLDPSRVVAFLASLTGELAAGTHD
jgi:DNA-binding MarR family transcriptional regulator